MINRDKLVAGTIVSSHHCHGRTAEEAETAMTEVVHSLWAPSLHGPDVTVCVSAVHPHSAATRALCPAQDPVLSFPKASLEFLTWSQGPVPGPGPHRRTRASRLALGVLTLGFHLRGGVSLWPCPTGSGQGRGQYFLPGSLGRDLGSWVATRFRDTACSATASKRLPWPRATVLGPEPRTGPNDQRRPRRSGPWELGSGLRVDLGL